MIIRNGVTLLFSIILYSFTLDAFSNQLCTLPEKIDNATSNGFTIDGELIALFLHEMSEEGCFEEHCSEDICKALDEFEKLEDEGEKVKQGAILTHRLREEVDTMNSEQQPWLISYKTSFINATEGFLAGGLPKIKAAEVKPNALTLYQGHNSGPLTEIDLSQPIIANCSSSNPSDALCNATFKLARTALLLQTQQHRLFFELLEKNKMLTAGYLTALDNRWETYNNHAAALFPWERYINARRFEKTTKNKDGFIEPPQTQILALHPTATLEFNSNSENNFEEALTIEVIGIHRWSYKSKYRQIGASLIASYNQTDDDIGYGILLRLPQNWAIGIVERNGNTSTVLSVDLAKFFTDNESSRSTFNKHIFK